MKKLILRSVGIVLVLVGLGLVMAYLAGMFGAKISPEATVRSSAVSDQPSVRVDLVKEIVLERAVGTIQAVNETLVSARITASIASIPVRAGDAVAQGDILVELDARELRARVQQQQQIIAAADARLSEAEPDYRRTKSLVDRGTLPKSALDRAEAARGAARAELARARDAADEARTALSYSTIHAPFSGRVIDRLAEQGDMATPGTPLVRLYDPEHLRLEANVRESLASRLSPGQMLQAKIDVLDDAFSVRVDEIVPLADPGSRSFLVKAAIPDRSDLYPGMFGRLLIPSGTESRLYVPRTAVSRVGQLEFVLVPLEGIPVRRYIRSGSRRDDGRIEVLSGLQADEQVIIPAS